MPTYDYRCKDCGHEMELFQSMSEKPKRKCPECGKLKLERLIGMGGALLFKGKGFWQTDYRSESYTEGEKKDKEASKKAESGADKKDSGKAKPKPAKAKADPKAAPAKPKKGKREK